MDKPRKLRAPSPLFRYAPVGARVLDAYFNEEYLVISHNDNGTVTVKWADGTIATHRFVFRHPNYPFDKRADQILNHMELLATG